MELIIGFIIASGVFGLVANFLVSGAKWLRSQGMTALRPLDPRVFAALTSLAMAVFAVLQGQDVNPASIQPYIETIALWLGTWAMAHFTHKTNSV